MFLVKFFMILDFFEKEGDILNFKAFNVRDIFKITKLYTLFEDSFPGGYEFSGEAHDFWECVYVKEGTATICASDKIYNLEKGDIIFHKPLEFHKYMIDDFSFAELFIFSFTLEGDDTTFFEDKVFKLDKHQRLIISQFLGFLYEKCGSDGVTAVRTHGQFGIKTLHTILSSEKKDILISIVINYIYSLLLSICDNATTINEAVLAHTDLYKKAVKYMHTHIGEKLSINDIAKYCATSTTSLKNTFMDFAGVGVHSYFLKMKISRAINLLSEGVAVGEISQMLGFSSQAYFSAAFKRETGVSPSRYEKK